MLPSHTAYSNMHDDVIKWKYFPRNWPFVRGIHRSPVNSPHKGQIRCVLMFSLINGWVNNREAGDLSRHGAHYDVIVIMIGRPVTVPSPSFDWWLGDTKRQTANLSQCWHSSLSLYGVARPQWVENQLPIWYCWDNSELLIHTSQIFYITAILHQSINEETN